MNHIVRLVGPNHAIEIFGVKLVGVNAENGAKLLFTLAFIGALMLARRAARWVLASTLGRERAAEIRSERVRFWSTQGANIVLAAVLILGLISIWFDDPTRLTTAAGLVTAGLAFALQRVITALAGYFVILRGKTFNVGDRITMGGVRGDVVALGFIQTTIMEMGQPAAVQNADPAMWVKARQYSGRIVTVTNDKIFDEPVYNYTREFPYIWEEIVIPISYKDDRAGAERILLEVGRRHTVQSTELSAEVLAEIERRYFIRPPDTSPRVYLRLTDNWVELTLRFIVHEHGIRELKDAMSREILDGLERSKIGIASGTYEIVGFPPVKVELDGSRARQGALTRAGENFRGDPDTQPPDQNGQTPDSGR